MDLRFQENIFRLQVAVDELSLLQHRKRVQQLRREDLDELSRKATKLVLLD